mmetsp:Transcript_23065/g.38616  ORF Transcript_23065/g.38616 Transcript_23065/m.38616 type:complete len:299 (-) Transcript_23065:526-1422(-)
MSIAWFQTGRSDPASMPAAGLSTGHNSRVHNHDLSHYHPFEQHAWTSNTTSRIIPKNNFPDPESMPNSLKTFDISGARPRSRPGLGMGNLVAPNGMYTLQSSHRCSHPLTPNYLWAPHHSEDQWEPRTWRSGRQEYGQKTSGLDIHDIEGTSPKKSKAGRTSYNNMNYNDVQGRGRWAEKFPSRPVTSLITADIAGARPTYWGFTRKRPGVAYDPIDKSSVTAALGNTATRQNIAGFGQGRWPPPSQVRHQFPRVGRETGPLGPIITIPTNRQLRPTDPNQPSQLGGFAGPTPPSWSL